MTKIEKRSSLDGVEVRAADDGKRTLVGYAAVFNSPAIIGGQFREQIAPGAFANAIKGDVRALVDHDVGRVIGRTKSGTMRMLEDSHGVKVEIDIPDTTDGNDLWTLVERGDISGMSFAFAAVSQQWEDDGQDLPLRTLIEVECPEVSAVAFPAYDDTDIGKRALQEHRDAIAAAAKPEEITTDAVEEIPAAAPVARAAAAKARLKMGLDLKLRASR
jgi:hypothetical protein